MNDLLILETYCRAHLDDRTAWRVYLDMREEVISVSHRRAVRVVARMHRDGVHARDLAQAAALLAAGSPVRYDLAFGVRRWLGTPETWNVTILLVPGYRSPRPSQNVVAYTPSRALYNPALVGARWLLRLHRLWLRAFQHDPLASITDAVRLMAK